MLVLVYLLAGLSVVALWMALAQPLLALGDRGRLVARPDNAINRSPFGPVVAALADIHDHPALATRCAAIERKLVEAGRPGGAVSPGEFLAAAELAGAGVAALFMGLLILVGAISVFGVVFSLALGAGTAGLVVSWLHSEAAARCRSIGRALPFFLDLGVMAIGAGASFRETMEIYGRSRGEDPLAQELGRVLSELHMGRTLTEALGALHDRIPVESLRTTLDAIVQGNAMGTAMGDILAEQAEVMRFKRSQAAERAAEELKVRLQPPVILMMLAVFMLILGPAVLRVLESGIL